jgi:hypothetical protein
VNGRPLHPLDECTRFDPADSPGTALLVELLRDSPTWLDPRPALEDEVVSVIGAARSRRRTSRRFVYRIAIGATAVAAACALVFGLMASDDAHAQFKGRLNASGSERGATGSAEVYRSRSGFRVVLDAAGLTELPADRYYEAWLADSNGSELPVGTFSSSRGEITLWSGQSSGDFARMTVTLESVDDNPAPSSDVVLAGELHRA